MITTKWQKSVTLMVTLGATTWLAMATAQPVQAQNASDALKAIGEAISGAFIPAKKWLVPAKAAPSDDSENVLSVATVRSLNPLTAIAIEIVVFPPSGAKPFKVVKTVPALGEAVIGPLQVTVDGEIKVFRYVLQNAVYVE